MNNNEIKNLLNSDELSVIEDEISSACKTYVNKEFIDQSIGILRRQISNSGLGLSNIHNQLISKRLSIIEFGIKFYSTSKVSIGSPIDEEYPKGEEIPKSLRSKVISSHGLGVGFGVVYAIYLHFLETDSNKLAEFLKKERIPNSDKYCKSLIKLFRP